MPLRPILYISTGTLRILVSIILVGILGFFALTRTQVGREGLRHQLTSQFTARFDGRLEIDRLQGNLVNDLFAGGVRLYDPSGRLVLSIDSVVARPRWRALLGRGISLRHLTLYRPDVRLFLDEDGRWSLPKALRSGSSGSSAGDPWSFTGLSITIENGAVQTRNSGAVPRLVEQRRIFDYTNSSAGGVFARVNVEWGPEERIVEVLSARTSRSSLELALESLRGQFVLDRDGVELNQLGAQFGETRLSGSLSLTGLGALREGYWAGVHVRADIPGVTLKADDIRRVLPGFPLGDVLQAGLQAEGPLSELTVEQFGLARGQSVAQLSGVISGLPERAEFEVALQESRIDVEDVAAVAPLFDLSSVPALGPVSVAAFGSGEIARPDGGRWVPRDVRANLSVRSSAGVGAATLRLSPGMARRFAYELEMDVQEMNLAPLLRNEALVSRITGTLESIGELDSLTATSGSLAVRLSPSSLAGRFVDTLRADLEVDERRLRGTMLGRDQGGAARLRLEALLGDDARYSISASALNLDAGRLLLIDSLRTDLTGSLSVTGSGRTWRDFRGSIGLRLDSSAVATGEDWRRIGPFRGSLELADNAAGGLVLKIDGDILEAELTSNVSSGLVVATAAQSYRSLRSFVEQEYLKPYPRLAGDHGSGGSAASGAAGSTSDHGYTGGADDRAVSPPSPEFVPPVPVRVSGRVQIRDATLLSMIVPGLPRARTDLQTSFRFHSDSTATSLTARMEADSLATERAGVRLLRSEFELRGWRAEPDREDPWTLSFDGASPEVRIGGDRVHSTRVAIRLDPAGGFIRLASADSLHDSRLDLEAEIHSLPDRTRLVLTNLAYAAGGYAWVNAEHDALDLYANAIIAHDVTFVNEQHAAEATQRIHLDGPFSRAPSDTLVVITENIVLHQLADAVLGGAPLGGNLSGRIALTGGLIQPELTGHLAISQLFLDNRLLGDLELQSRYVPGLPDLELEARLTPSDREPPLHAPGTTRSVVVESNSLTLRGLVRLPQFDENSNRIIPSSLALTLDAERADAFFFDYLFDEITEVDGYLTGVGSIGGTFRKPVFGGSFRLQDASFRVPDYNLALSADADVSVDQQGIHVSEARIEDKTGGAGLVRGAILFNDYRYFSFDLSAQLEDVQIMDVMRSSDLSFYGRIWASGNVTLRGPLDAAVLQSSDLVTNPRSEVFIPLEETAESSDAGFIVFADSSGAIPDFESMSRRRNLIASRPVGERAFVDALEMDLNIFVPPGSTIHLVIDPLLGDVMNAVSSGRVQLLRTEGEYYTYGSLDVTSGDYLFTAGDVFVRRFLIDEGTIRWDGDPTDAQLNVTASFRTRASTAGLPGLATDAQSAPLIPMMVRLHIMGRVSTPAVDLRLALERTDRDVVGQRLEAILNDPDRSTQYATSVLLTNTFLLTTDQFADSEQGLSGTRNQFAFNSVSQLVANQINRYLSEALPNVDVNFGLQGERAQELDVTYGVALRLMDERLVIRGEGVYQNDQQNAARGEFVVQIRLSPTVSVEMFYRREGDVLSDQTLTNTTGAGVSYQTRFSSWPHLVRRLFGRTAEPEEPEEAEEADEEATDEITDAAADAG